jgi:Zn-dependent peptidase ImmA (M78 family)
MSIINELRQLMPHRPLSTEEARAIAERQASRFRELLGLSDEPFLPRDAVASLPKVSVAYDADLPQSGSSHWTGAVWQITVNGSEPFTRQRYTMAHELKHILDAPFDEYCYSGPGGGSATQRAEYICDYFAACVLMPKRMVVQAFTSGVDLQRPAELARIFGVSTRAIQVRLQELGLIDAKYRCRTPLRPASARRFYRSARPTRELITVFGGS